MITRRVLAAALVVGMGVGVLAQSAPAFADGYSPSAASGFVGAINSLRAAHGVGPLSVNSSLVSMADGWAVHLAGVGSLSHNPNLAGQAPGGWRLLGENVGVGPDLSALQAAFTASPEHYANMIDPRFSEIGVGVYMSSQGYMWVTEDYMEPPSGAAVAAPVVSAPRATAAAPSTVTARPVALTTSVPAPAAHVAPAASAPVSPAPVHAAAVATPVATPSTPAPHTSPTSGAKLGLAPNQTHGPARPLASRPLTTVSSRGLGGLVPAVSRYATTTRNVALVLLVPLAGLAWVRRPSRRFGHPAGGRVSTC